MKVALLSILIFFLSYLNHAQAKTLEVSEVPALHCISEQPYFRANLMANSISVQKHPDGEYMLASNMVAKSPEGPESNN